MIALGSDHGGFLYKEELKKHLDEKGIEYIDFGTDSTASCDYPVYAEKVCKAIQSGECEKGILICRSGYGMAMVANKFKGIRSAPCFQEQAAKYSRMHNDSNVLALGADYVTTNEAICIVRMWLATEFEGGRHKNRIDLLEKIESIIKETSLSSNNLSAR